MMRYDFLQRRLCFNTDAMKFLKSNRVRFTANRALCTFRVAGVHGIDTNSIGLSLQGVVPDHDVISLMQWMRMDTNNRALVGAVAMVPVAAYILEGSYVDLVTRRAAAIAGEVAVADAEGALCATSPG
jgi:hypothetical protein